MFNSKLFLDALPDVWKTYFKDTDILKALYSFIGTELSFSLESVLSHSANLSLDYVPLTRHKPWGMLQVDVNASVEIVNSQDNSLAIKMYGLIIAEGFAEDCYRLYPSPVLKDKYLEKQKDFEILRTDSIEVRALFKRAGKELDTNLHTHYLVLKGVDPLLDEDWPKLDNLGVENTPNLIKVPKNSISQVELDLLKTTQIINLATSEASYRTSIITTIDTEEYLEIYLQPQISIVKDFDNTTFTIEELTSTVPVKLDLYLVNATLINLWGLGCTVDEYELYNKFGWLANNKQAVIRSSERYRNYLDILRKIKLRGLTIESLRSLGNILFNSSVLKFSSSEDPILELNLVSKLLRTNIEFYTVDPKSQFTRSVIYNVPKYITFMGNITKDQCRVFRCESSYVAIHRYLVLKGSIDIKTTQDTLVGTIFLAVEDSSFVYKAEAPIAEGVSLRVYLESDVYIPVPAQDYSDLGIDTASYSGGTYINSYFKAEDINTDVDWWYTEGQMIPYTVWKTPVGRRRTVTTTSWDRVIGSMPVHRVGDYSLTIPTQGELDSSNTTTLETGYKLYRDFLRNKTAYLNYSSVANISITSSIQQVIDTTQNLLNADKMVLTTNSFEVVDFIKEGTDALDIVVKPNPTIFEEGLLTVGNEGIGSENILVFVEMVDLNHGIQVTDTFTLYGSEFTVIAVYNQYVLASIQGNLPNNLDYTVIPNNLVHDGVNKNIASGYVTNVISQTEASNIRMVIGNSYPDYTFIYPHTANTVHQTLEISVIP